MATKNFKSGAAYKNWLGYIHANDLDKKGGADVTIKGKKHKVDRSAAKQTKDMKTNQDGGGDSSTEAADQLKELGSPARSMGVKIKPKTEEKKSPAPQMDHYEDKEASMDDWSHEKKLAHDGRWQLEQGDTTAAKNDFDHAHALKKDAHDDAFHRHSRSKVMKHMGSRS